jgi:excisionase family DNA binding protein
MSDQLLNEEEAAEYLGKLPLTTLRNLVRKKHIDHVKIGRSTGVKREHLDAYIDAHTVRAVENPWGMTDGALQAVRSGRTRRTA